MCPLTVYTENGPRAVKVKCLYLSRNPWGGGSCGSGIILQNLEKRILPALCNKILFRGSKIRQSCI